MGDANLGDVMSFGMSIPAVCFYFLLIIDSKGKEMTQKLTPESQYKLLIVPTLETEIEEQLHSRCLNQLLPINP